MEITDFLLLSFFYKVQGVFRLPRSNLRSTIPKSATENWATPYFYKARTTIPCQTSERTELSASVGPLKDRRVCARGREPILIIQSADSLAIV